MSGHSKWATIKRKKEKLDSARGRTFSKLIKEITIAARLGGGDESGNPRLRTAIAAAKAANMPAGNIDRAVKKGTGELPGVSYEEAAYEAYGPGGTALLIEVLTDNKNRCVSEIRHIVNKYGGNMAEAGSVSWMFSRLGQITIPADGIDEDVIMMSALDAGAEDVRNDEDVFTVTTRPDSLEPVRAALEKGGWTIESGEIAKVPQTLVPIQGSPAKTLLRLMDALEEHDDVQRVWSNFDTDEELDEE